MKPITLSYITLLFVVLLLAGCSESMDALEQEPAIEGTVTQVNTEHQPYFRFLVEEDAGVNQPLEQGGKKIWFSLDNESRILIRDEDGTHRPAEISDIRVGQEVKGWAREGILADSYPQQGLAEQVTIRD